MSRTRHTEAEIIAVLKQVEPGRKRKMWRGKRGYRTRINRSNPLDCITTPAPETRNRLWFVENHGLGRKEPDMLIIGVDYHPSDQYIAFADTETGECGERRLNHSEGEAEKFYRDLQSRAASVRVGMERNIAKVAMARRLGVRLYWMWRNGWEYAEWVKFGSNAGQLGTGHGAK